MTGIMIIGETMLSTPSSDAKSSSFGGQHPVRGLRRKTLLNLAFGLTFLAGVAAAFPALADSYQIVSQDKIKLRVVEWHSGEGEYKNWEPLNGDYVVNQSGAISIPIVGEVPAIGMTTEDLANKVAFALQQRAGLPNKPFISVEIAQYGPIYLAGNVQTPGQYQYSPDLTVMKAVSLAGGFQRVGEDRRSQINRDRIQASGTLGDAQLDYNTMMIREARLRAEMAGRDSFDIPPALSKVDGATEIHAEELNLLKFRRAEIDSKIASSQDLDTLYANSIETLQGKIQAQQHQVALFQKQLATVATLVDKGLTVSSRQFELDQAQSDAESKLLDLEFQLVQSKQALEENKRDAATAVNAMNSQVQGELSTTIREISKADLQMRISQALLVENDREGQQDLAAQNDSTKLKPKLIIARQNEKGETQRFEATPDTPVKPRDLIEVESEDTTSISN
jgi:polysaccharide biosynthesis/export protein ExoF